MDQILISAVIILFLLLGAGCLYVYKLVSHVNKLENTLNQEKQFQLKRKLAQVAKKGAISPLIEPQKDPEFKHAVEIARYNRTITSEQLQEILNIGYGRSARIYQELLKRHFIERGNE